MTYTTVEARQQVLDALAESAEQLSVALAALSELYERLDELSADALEKQLFRPVQSAYGRLQRTHAEFARRSSLSGRTFSPAPAAAPAHGVRELLDGAVSSVGAADQALASLQDSMLPVEVGDTQLRAELEQVRSTLDGTRSRARELQRTLGR